MTFISRLPSRESFRRIRLPQATRLFVFIVVVALTGCMQQSQDSESLWIPEPLLDEAAEEPDAAAIMAHMSEFMSSHQELAAEAFVTYEVLQESGQILSFDMLQRITYRKPDKLHWVVVFDDGTQESAWFNNGSFAMLKEPALVYGQIEVSSSVSEMVLELEEDYGLDVPFVDILSGQMADLWLGGDVSSRFVGEAWVDGTWTDHIALRREGVDFEIWIRKGEQPFPVKLSIVLTEEDGMPRNTTRFRKWANVVPSSVSFDFVPPEGAEQIEVVPVLQY